MINFRLFLLFFFMAFFSFDSLEYRGIKYFTNYNYYHNFLIDFKGNRFCYQQCSPYELGIKYSQGDIRLVGDTIFIKSDNDFMNLPINVVGNTKSGIEKSKISITFGGNVYKGGTERSEFRLKDYGDISRVIVNGVDTIGLNDGSLFYEEPIRNVCLIGIVRPMSFYELELENTQKMLAKERDTVVKQAIHWYLKNLAQDSIANPTDVQERVVYKTAIYENVNNYNEINLSLNFLEVGNYITINDTMIFKEGFLTGWAYEEERVTIRNTVLDSIKKHTTFRECIDN